MRHLRQGFFSVFPNFYKNSFLMITIPIEFARLIWRMILANSSVREAAKTARVCLIRHAPLAASLYSLFIQNHYAKSGKVGFFETNSGSVNESLIRGSFFVRNWEGIEVLAKPIFARGVSPFHGSAPRTGPCRPRSSSKMDSLAWLRCAQSALFSPLRGKMLPHFILPESLIL